MPEFRTLSSGGVKACSKMLQILATYKDIPEQTALNLLSNDLLLDGLKSATTDKQFHEQIEAAFLEENRYLMEEKAGLTEQLVKEKGLREKRELELNKIEQELKITAQTLAEQEKTLKDKEAVLHTLESQQSIDSHQIREFTEKVIQEKQEKEEAKRHTTTLEQQIDKAESRRTLTIKVASIVVAILLVLLFEITINSLFKWDWLLTHKSNYGLQICFSLILLFTVIGICVRPWRKWLFGAGIFSTFLLIIKLVS